MVNIVKGDLPAQALAAAYKSRVVGVDIETSRLPVVDGKLDLSQGKIAMVQVFIPGYRTVMIRELDTLATNLAQLLENAAVTKVFHYASFDLNFLMRELPFIFPASIADTKIAAAFFDPKRTYFVDDAGKGSHSLKVLVKKVFGYDMDKSISISDWFVEDLTPAQLEYAAKDVEYLPRLLNFLERGIEARDRRLMPVLAESFRFLPSKVMIDLKIGRDVFAYQ